MNDLKTVLITGASGNLGAKLRRHLQGRYELRLLDIDPKGDPDVKQADLSAWNEDWVGQMENVDTVVHFAANPSPCTSWAGLIGPNIDALFHLFAAAVSRGVKRVVFASSNHVMGAYQNIPEPKVLTADTPPHPGADWKLGETLCNSAPYGAAKLMGERLGKVYAKAHGLSCIAVRIGWTRFGENRGSDIPAECGDWFRLMWLSNRDFCQLMERCIEADPAIRFAVINGMSANTGMRWDIENARELVGYEPVDDVCDQ